MNPARRRALYLTGGLLTVPLLPLANLPSDTESHGARPVLARDIPNVFGRWTNDPASPLAVVTPQGRLGMQDIYQDTLSRVYRADDGSEVMLMVAWGSNQVRRQLQAHQPEACYGASGFAVEPMGIQRLGVGATSIPLTRLQAVKAVRREFITYWFTVGDTVVTPGWDRKWLQFRLGLGGGQSGGVLVRVSTLADKGAFDVHDDFILSLHAALQGSPLNIFGRNDSHAPTSDSLIPIPFFAPKQEL